jgi:hypothetical protein
VDIVLALLLLIVMVFGAIFWLNDWDGRNGTRNPNTVDWSD